MCNIILYHTATQIPNHLIHCIYKIRELSSIPIYLLTDTDVKIDDTVETININKYDSLMWLSNLDYFSNDHYKNLWQTSCYRLFYIQLLIEEKNLTNTLHFDNDVLLYETPESIISKMIELNYSFGITAHNSYEVVMGMSFLKNSLSLKPIINFVEKELQLPMHLLQQKYNGWPNEMNLMNSSSHCEYLPILPDGLTDIRYTNNFKIFNSVFDPSSYGQFLGGTFQDKKPGWFGVHQEIGKYIANNNINIIVENKFPYVVYNGSKIKINNLHIHSKLTENFL
jgi:hypothetical protein